MKRGHWRASPDAVKFSKCVPEEPCLGGRDYNTACRPDHGGAHCTVCSPLADQTYYFKIDVAQCMPCPAPGEYILDVLAIPVGSSIAGLLVVQKIISLVAKPSKSFSMRRQQVFVIVKRVQVVVSRLGLMAKMKMLIGFIQVVTIIPVTYGVVMPDVYFELFVLPFSYLNFNWFQLLLPSECVGTFRSWLQDRLQNHSMWKLMQSYYGPELSDVPSWAWVVLCVAW